MNAFVAAVLWAGFGLGLTLAVAGLLGRPVLPDAGGSQLALPVVDHATVVRIATSLGVGVLMWALTGWLAAGLLGGLAAWAAPRLLGGRAARETSVARTEAIASWTEMIRDSIVAASGLEEAICATGPIAPEPIGSEVRALVERLDPHTNLQLPDALRAFADDVDHPSADLVVAALTLAARLEASDLSGLLSRLAEAIRDDARMRIRVEVGRTRIRTAAKVIVGVVAATLVLLAVANRDYLHVYDGGTGQLVLLVVGAIFATGGWLLDRMATIDLPPRFSSRDSRREASWS